MKLVKAAKPLRGGCLVAPSRLILSFFFRSFVDKVWSSGRVVKALDSQFMGSMLKSTKWLQNRLSLSSFCSPSNSYQEFLGI